MGVSRMPDTQPAEYAAFRAELEEFAQPAVLAALDAHEASGECTYDEECECAARCAFCNVEHFPTFHDREA